MQTVKGHGFTFTAPAGWAETDTADGVMVADGKVDLLQVAHFRLEKPYRIAELGAVSKELDHVADGLATQAGGKVADRQTVQVAGRKTRYYRIDFGAGKTEEIAFVLVGQDEYQVLCRRESGAPDTTCAQLFSSFALTSG
ncbi:MAG TPA: hypothetical protein VG265_00305 [Gaiellaceae bacterium]|nr:hypothetical protein [Gaiellaceae bacterium]